MACVPAGRTRGRLHAESSPGASALLFEKRFQRPEAGCEETRHARISWPRNPRGTRQVRTPRWRERDSAPSIDQAGLCQGRRPPGSARDRNGGGGRLRPERVSRDQVLTFAYPKHGRPGAGADATQVALPDAARRPTSSAAALLIPGRASHPRADADARVRVVNLLLCFAFAILVITPPRARRFCFCRGPSSSFGAGVRCLAIHERGCAEASALSLAQDPLPRFVVP
jgi:hypothetical protein